MGHLITLPKRKPNKRTREKGKKQKNRVKNEAFLFSRDSLFLRFIFYPTTAAKSAVSIEQELQIVQTKTLQRRGILADRTYRIVSHLW